MGHKMDARAMRLGVNKTWKSLWYSDDKKEYRKRLKQDIEIREYLMDKFRIAGLDRIEISRSANNISVNVYVARPGVAIGRGGEAIDLVKTELSRRYQTPVDVKVNEVKKPELSARVIARNVAEGMEKRQSPKKLLVTERDRVMGAGAAGVMIWISGDFGVPKQSRVIKISEGVVPLQTIRAGVDFAIEVAQVRNAGLHGVKVWIYRGDEDQGDDDKK